MLVAKGSEVDDDDAKGSDDPLAAGLPNAPPKAPPNATDPKPGEGGGAGASAAAAPRRRVPEGAAGAPKPPGGAIDKDMAGNVAAEITVAGCDAVSLILMTNFFFLGWSSSSSSLQSFSSPPLAPALDDACGDFCDALSPNISDIDGCELGVALGNDELPKLALLSEAPKTSELEREKGAGAAATSGLD